jgi:hypothetical protein
MTSYSLPGLKGHITKKHTQKTKKQRDKKIADAPNKEHEILIPREADKIVTHLIQDMINLVDANDGDSDTDSCVTLEEECQESDRKGKNEYSNTCDECDYKVTTVKKYVALQQMSNHKDTVHFRSCNFCEFKAKNKQEMKRHTRDAHAITTGSTSPPTKKKKKCDENNEKVDTNEIMDVDNISILSEQLEDMDIEEEEVKEDNDVTLKERSEKNDYKVRKQAGAELCQAQVLFG